MSWHYLQEQGAEFSVEHYLAGIQSARAKSSHTPAASSSTTRNWDSSPASPSGTTYAPSMAPLGAALSTLCPAASLARTSHQQAKEQASPAPAPASGLKCTESFAKYNHATHSWKTPQCSLLADLDEYSETWPKSGIMLHGACWELPTAAPPTAATESGFLRFGTPTATMRPRSKRFQQGANRLPNPAEVAEMELGKPHHMLPTPTCQDAANNGGKSQTERNTPPLNAVVGGALNPVWVEWLMGWPLGWTDLKHSATARFRSWLRQHSKSLNTD